MLKLQFYITIIILLFNWSLASQEIRGIIYSDNIPLPDVNIKIRGKSEGTKSDQKGEFNLKSKKGDLIIFSHVGMETKKIKIKNFDPLKITMTSKLTKLKEVEIKSINKKNKPKTIISRFREIEVDKVGYTAYSFSGEDIRSYSNIPCLCQAHSKLVPSYSHVILLFQGYSNVI